MVTQNSAASSTKTFLFTLFKMPVRQSSIKHCSAALLLVFLLTFPVGFADRKHLLRMSLPSAVKYLHSLGNPQVAEDMAKFYKAVDVVASDLTYLGVADEDVHVIADSIIQKGFATREAFDMMDSPYAEQRLLSLLMLKHRYEKSKEAAQWIHCGDMGSLQQRRTSLINEFVLRIPTHLTNSHLIDEGVPPILGEYVTEHVDHANILRTLAKSASAWERRAAVMGAVRLIKMKDFREFDFIHQLLEDDEADLVREPLGILLRMVEAAKLAQGRANAAVASSS